MRSTSSLALLVNYPASAASQQPSVLDKLLYLGIDKYFGTPSHGAVLQEMLRLAPPGTTFLAVAPRGAPGGTTGTLQTL